MNILGFHGVHPLALLVFPAALALVACGPLHVLRRWKLVPAWLRNGYLALYAALALAAGLWLPSAVKSYKLALMSYAAILAGFALLYALFLAALWWSGRGGRVCPPRVDLSRRKVLAGSVALLAAPLGAMAASGAADESGGVAVRAVSVNRSAQALPGRPLRVSFISDLHAGFYLPQSYLAQALRHVEAFKPEAVLLGGDLTDYDLAALKEVRPFLRSLAGLAPVYGVLGNHDCYVNPAEVAAFQRDCGVNVLRGQRTTLSGSFGSFHLCGARDLVERERPGKSLGPADTMASTLFLAHNPALALRLPAATTPWLTLSGHTHGGQIRLPGVGSLVNQADRRLEPGLNTVDGRQVLITAGIGFAGLPLRLFCPPEVLNLTIA